MNDFSITATTTKTTASKMTTIVDDFRSIVLDIECEPLAFTDGGEIALADKTDALGMSKEELKEGANKNDKCIVAAIPTEKHSLEYNMNHKNRGMAVIFNNERFKVPHLQPRRGTDKDCADLTAVLKDLGFEVSVHKDLEVDELFAVAEKAAARDHSDSDCIAIIILTHGEVDHIYARDVPYTVKEIAAFFTPANCPTLAGKPKLFFIQACQGQFMDPGVKFRKFYTETDGSSSASYRIPLHADFLFSYATIPGYVSWRCPEKGSWYIQELVRELKENASKYDLLMLLTFVTQRVSIDHESATRSLVQTQKKQVPCITTMLTRILRFPEKKCNENDVVDATIVNTDLN